ncbi:MAG: hypothetical protein ACD_35C00166G0003 [uncultured bacterium]|nr:MAG: hypothetical protein ACD_35C00166G0003 [uncultured bacterium]HCS38467.1 hypothetical protein [Anaerolineaceae bacterium]
MALLFVIDKSGQYLPSKMLKSFIYDVKKMYNVKNQISVFSTILSCILIGINRILEGYINDSIL